MKITRPSIGGNPSYWDDFYKNLKLSVPSQFCAMIAVELSQEAIVMEFGCGNGRDSLYFASRGHQVVAMDLSQLAIDTCTKGAEEKGFSHALFVKGSLADKDDVAKHFSLGRELSNGNPLMIYSRFVMHSINDVQQSSFLNALGEQLETGERVFFEFRSKEDAELEKTFGNHYRRFVDTDVFIDECKENGLNLEYRITGQGMARFKTEDPFVSRLIFIRD